MRGSGNISDKNFKNCVLIDIDGCRKDLLYDLIDKGKLPVIAGIFKQGMRFGNVQTVFPTATFPTQASAITGVYPRNHGIMSNTWMNRRLDDCPLYNYTENFFHAARVYKYSLFGFPSLVFADNNGTGLADEHIAPGIKTLYQEAKSKNLSSLVAFHQFEQGADKWIRPKPIDMITYFFGNLHRPLFKYFDESMISRVVKEISKSVPHILFLYFASSDGTGHWWGAEGQEWYLVNIVEEKLGRVIKELEKKNKMDSTLFVLFADHGHSDVTRDKEHCIPLNEITGVLKQFQCCKSISTTGTSGADCVIALEGGMADIYIKSRFADTWKTLPTPAELLPVAKKLHSSLKGKLGAVAYRDTEKEKYCFLPGENPMNLNLEKISGKIKREYWHKNSPDIMLFSNYAAGYHFYKEPLKSIHGNINDGDFNIPLIFAGKGIKPGENDKRASIVDIAPTVANLMGFSMNGADGRNIKLIGEQ